MEGVVVPWYQTADAQSAFRSAIASVKARDLYQNLPVNEPDTRFAYVANLAYAPRLGDTAHPGLGELSILTAIAKTHTALYGTPASPTEFLKPLLDASAHEFSQYGCFGKLRARHSAEDSAFLLRAVKEYRKTARTTVAFDTQSGMWQVRTPGSATVTGLSPSHKEDSSFYRNATKTLADADVTNITEGHLTTLNDAIDKHVATLTAACADKPEALAALESLLDTWAETVHTEVAYAIAKTRAFAFQELWKQKVHDGKLVGAVLHSQKPAGDPADAVMSSAVSVLHSGDPLLTALLNVVRNRVSTPALTDEEIRGVATAFDGVGVPDKPEPDTVPDAVAARLRKVGFQL